MGNYIVVENAYDKYHVGQIILVGKYEVKITLILGDKVYIKHLDTFEWIGLNFRRLLKKIGL